MLAYKLPTFLDFLYLHYQHLYKLYYGRLTELFPSSENTEKNLSIAEDEASTAEEDEKLYRLWEAFK